MLDPDLKAIGFLKLNRYNDALSTSFQLVTMYKKFFNVVLFAVLLPAAANDQQDAIKTSVSLAPHLTELIYSAGAGDQLLGVSAYSNYPPEVSDKTTVGDAFHVNLELIKSLSPDVIYYWKEGTPAQTVSQLQQLGITLIAPEITQLEDIPATIEAMARQLGTAAVPETQFFLPALKTLKQQQYNKQPALIQIANQPIYTVNGDHLMSQAISVCGLSNVFADLEALSAAVTLEAVVLKKPEVIVTLENQHNNNPLLKWESIPAIANNRIISLNPDHFTRPTLRLLLAIEDLCSQLH